MPTSATSATDYLGRTEHSHLKRLDRIWIENLIFFITACIDERRNILANSQAVAIFIEEWTAAKERRDWHIGCYVTMAGHVHFFCTPWNEAQDISVFMKIWKEGTSKKRKKECRIDGHVWQREFLAHILRSEESYI